MKTLHIETKIQLAGIAVKIAENYKKDYGEEEIDSFQEHVGPILEEFVFSKMRPKNTIERRFYKNFKRLAKDYFLGCLKKSFAGEKIKFYKNVSLCPECQENIVVVFEDKKKMPAPGYKEIMPCPHCGEEIEFEMLKTFEEGESDE